MSVLRWICWLLTSAYWGVLFALTHMPPEQLSRAPRLWDKGVHCVAYFLLASLLGASLMLTFPRRRWIPVWVLVIGMVYAAVDELLQPFVRRDAELLDWVADALGVWCGVFVLWAMRKVLVARQVWPGTRAVAKPPPPLVSESAGAAS
jgi:VanZ family protein